MATKVYGASDDLVDFEGDVYGEVGHYSDESPCFIAFSDGTMCSFYYAPDDLGIWKASLLREGDLFERIDVCTDEDANPHSDIVHFRDGLKWAFSSGNMQKVR